MAPQVGLEPTTLRLTEIIYTDTKKRQIVGKMPKNLRKHHFMSGPYGPDYTE